MKKIILMLKKIGKGLKFLLTPVLRYKNDPVFRRIVRYTRYYKKKNIMDNVVFYESYHGKSMTDNPFAIFDYLISNPKYSRLVHVWALVNLDDKNAQKYKHLKNVKFVKLHSRDYLKYLASAKYLINNTTFPPYFQKKEGQIYINTWHGTPLKTLGKDMKGEIGQHKNILRNLLHCDYLVNPNKYTADIIIDSHDLRGIYNGYVVDTGYPRIDTILKTDIASAKKKVSEIIEVDPRKKFILYAPTWRGEVGKVVNPKEEIVSIIEKLHERIPEDAELLLKVHTLVYQYIKDDDRLKRICVPDWYDTNELLAAVDVLITDYSSIFFDFLVTKRPIIYFVYDRDTYETKRGLYLNIDDLPGTVCYNIDEVIHALENIERFHFEQKDKYESFYQKYCYNDDGANTEKLVRIVFENERNPLVYKVSDHGKKKNILFYCGGFFNNGITTSAINLLDNLDYSKFNAVVIDKEKYDESCKGNFLKINPNAKILFRTGTFNTTLLELLRHMLVLRLGLKNAFIRKLMPYEVYKREISRLLGNAHIDIAVDFSGYVPLWSLLISSGDFERKVIFQHSDMWEEYNKKINGQFKHRLNLNVVFPLYKKFDKIISVSRHTLESNLKNIVYMEPSKSSYVHNSLNYELILNKSKTGDTVFIYDKEYFISRWSENYGSLSISGIEIPRAENINFVTMGRLSPEKDHKKLIRAFSRVSQMFENTRLYVVGDGVLKKDLQALIDKLDLSQKVILTGQLSNPFYLINKCDCFILSSNHEGQPLSLLEMMVLHKPIISTDIPGARSVLEDGYGELVENSEDGLFTGMINFIQNGLTYKKFDYIGYNKYAMKMFYSEVCGMEMSELSVKLIKD